ncbi:MAG: formylglycine-generating enzyme family protein [Nitrospinales bacterium]
MKMRLLSNRLMALGFGLFLFFLLVAASPPGSQEAMVLIPGGQFHMGSNDHGLDEKPVHVVRLDSFYMDKYEVTQRDFERVMGKNPSRFKGADRPVDRATWFAAKAYCRKVGKRLPTEAEWEYAIRGGSKGGGFGGFWFKGNSNKQTHPVGLKQPNALGLYDMLGNLWEWVEDWYGEDYYKTGPPENPKGPPAGEFKVLRGGSWKLQASLVRPANRLRGTPGKLNYNYGFRCVRDVTPLKHAASGGNR